MPTPERRDALSKAVAAYHVGRVYADAISRPAQKGVFPQFPRETRPMQSIGKTPVNFSLLGSSQKRLLSTCRKVRGELAFLGWRRGASLAGRRAFGKTSRRPPGTAVAMKYRG